MRRIYHPRISDSDGTLPVIHGGLGSRDIDKAAQNIGLVTYRLANKPFGIILYNAQKRINKDSLPPEISDPSVPSLYGNREVEVGQTLILKITNYDSFTIYSVFATNGVAIQRGEEIHYTAGAVSGPGSITINGRTFSITIKSPRPSTPSVVVPSEDSQLTNTTATFEASAFNITGNYDIHASTDWEVSIDPQFNTLIAAIYETTVHKLTWTVNNMQELKKHYVRVRYRGQQRGVSDWSPVREFTTGNDGLINTEMGIILAPDGISEDWFGSNIVLNSDSTIALISAHGRDDGGVSARGAVYVFTRSGGTWTYQQKILAPDPALDDWFGLGVGINSDATIALIGACLKDEGGLIDRGVVYYYTRSGTTWTYQSKILINDLNINSYFGAGIALNNTGDYALIGAYGKDEGGILARGVVYIYTRSGSTWTYQNKILAPDAQPGDYFGRSVAINKDATIALIGAYNRSEAGVNCGAVYHFTRSGSIWSYQNKLLAPDRANGDQFGLYLSIDSESNKALIGSRKAKIGTEVEAGAVYAYSRNGTSWSFQNKIIASDYKAYNQFGVSVKLSSNGTMALIGAQHRNSNGITRSGAVYIFE